MKLSNEDIKKFQASLKDFNHFSGAIEQRLTEVLKIVCECFGTTLSWFGYSGETGGSHYDGGSLQENWDGDIVNLYVVADNDPPNKELHNMYSDLLCEFPTKYLAMDDEDIKNECKKMIQDELDIIQNTKNKAKKTKEDKAKKKAAVLAKLSEEDKKLLGLK